MIKIISAADARPEDILTRDIKTKSGVEDIVSDIIDNVRENGDKALIEYGAKFDGADITALEVTQQEIDEAFESEDADYIATLQKARDNIQVVKMYHFRDVSVSFLHSNHSTCLISFP